MRKAFHYVLVLAASSELESEVTASVQKPSSGANVQTRKLNEVTHRVLQELFALLVGDSGFAPPRIRILSAALVRELSLGEVPYFFRDNFNGNFQLYDQNKARLMLLKASKGQVGWNLQVVYFLPVLSQLSPAQMELVGSSDRDDSRLYRNG